MQTLTEPVVSPDAGEIRLSHRHHRWRYTGIYLFALAATGVRLALLFRYGGLHSTIEYDDGVHYGSALLLLHGVVPYRDTVFLQPPGITVVLLPAALIGVLTKASIGFAVARLATAAVAGITTVLLGRIVARRSGAAKGLVAAAVYAFWMSGIVAGSTVMLEPWLSLCVVLSLGVLLRAWDPAASGQVTHDRSAVLAGAAMGVGCSIKIWGAVAAAVVMGWLLLHGQFRIAKRYMAGAVAGAAVVCGPFFLLAPSRAFQDIITTQASRPPSGIAGIWDRWENMVGTRLFSSAQTGRYVALLVLAMLLACMARAGADRLGKLAAAQLAGAAALFMLGRPYYTHYGEYVAPFIAIVVAAGLPGLSRTAPGAAPALVTAASLLVVLALCGVQLTDAFHHVRPASVDTHALESRLAGAQCVVSDDFTLLILADVPTRCGWLDSRGDALSQLRPPVPVPFDPSGVRRITSWQADWLSRFSHADAAVLEGQPCADPVWDSTVCTYVVTHFRRLGRVGTAGPNRIPVEVWTRSHASSSMGQRLTAVTNRSRPSSSQ
jgi:hypothetical protein